MTYLADLLIWSFCWLACRLVMVLPMGWRLTLWLLPFAGYYGYHVPGLTTWRWSRRIR